MNTVSEEQQIIIDIIKNGDNVSVDACAGSGKSTTILSTACSQPNKKFLLITYNKSLRKEIQEKVRELDLKNITVHTYHSLAVSIYDAEAHVDKVMRLLVQKNTPPSRLIPTDVLVLDEAQDMTFLYFRLIIKYLNDLNTPVQIMVLGDFMQGLYEFKGADIRFLTKASDIWEGFSLLKSHIFTSCSLRTSYRITKPMADFVNNILLDKPRLIAVKDGEPVCYIRRKIYDLERFIVTTIRDLISKGSQPSDFFVLGGSVKGPNSLIRRIENALVDANIPCHVPMMENAEQIDEEVIKGKIVFSSFHTSKGRQRPYVFIIGFDNSYFKTIARTLDPNTCPNTLYVATTRASNRLFLLESDEWASDRPLKFLKMSHQEMKIQPYIDFRGIPRSRFEEEPPASCIKEVICHKVTPTELTKFISESVLEEITGLLDSLFVKEREEKPLELPTIVRTQAGFYEDVSDLHGIAIPSMLYDYIDALYDNDETTNSGILYRMICENLSHTKPNKHLYLKNQPLVENCESINDYLYMANVLEASQEKLYFKLKQIQRDEYTWLSFGILSDCKRQLMNVLKKEIKIGKPVMEHVIISYDDDYSNEIINQSIAPFLNDTFAFSARIDLMTERTLWELKCTSEISAEHMIQTVIYAWIMRTLDKKFSKKIKIFNIKTGQVLRLEASLEQLRTIVVAILKGKYEKKPPSTEADFITECRELIKHK